MDLFSLSYSNFKSYRECPKKYRFKLDKAPYPAENKANALFGSVVGVLFEEFYTQKMWVNKDPVSDLKALYPTVLKKVALSFDRPGKSFLDLDSKGSINKSLPGLEDEVFSSLEIGVENILRNDLVGEDAKAEVAFDVPLDYLGLYLVGRADFVLTSKTHGFIILDGKGSKHGTKYLDVDQLMWYALQCKLKGIEVPSKVAFVNWRFRGEGGVVWHRVTPESLDDILLKLAGFSKFLRDSNPKARPGSSCKYCPYVPLCFDGQVQLGGRVDDDVFEV